MPRHNTTCEQCGNTFYASPNRKRKGQGRFCSVACRGLAKQATLEQRFWNRVQKTDTCWLWQGILSPSGYGITSTHEGRIFAHRLAYQFAKGPIPEGYFICHQCDNPPCVNPNHLFAGTPQDNTSDMWDKGRGIQGEAHPNSKLSFKLASEIRTIYAQGGISQRALAKQFGVTKGLVWGIVSGRYWTE